MPRTFAHDDEAFRGGHSDGWYRPSPRKPVLLYKDEHLAIVNKPAGLPVDDPDDCAPSVHEMMFHEGLYESGFGPEATYMLDPEVSGALLLPRTSEADESLDAQAKSGELSVLIRAIVRGPILENTGEIARHVGFAGHGTTARMRIVTKGGFDARTRWMIEDRYIGYALLACHTMPLLPHQIRLLLFHAGMPLAVDPLYGGGRDLLLSSFKTGYRPSRRHPERPLIDRVSMHVARVMFRHPVTDAQIEIDAPPPKDFRAAVHQLGRFARVPR